MEVKTAGTRRRAVIADADVRYGSVCEAKKAERKVWSPPWSSETCWLRVDLRHLDVPHAGVDATLIRHGHQLLSVDRLRGARTGGTALCLASTVG